jgi:hypothetical protein
MANLTSVQIKDSYQSVLTTSETTSDPTTGTLQNGKGTAITALTVSGALTLTGDLTVDTSTLKVDSANNRVGIGTSTPNGSLHILNSSAGTTPSNYLRIEGSVANNSNYPGIELKGGTLSDGGYPNITLTNGGLAIILQSGFGASSNEQRNQISLNASSGITFLTSTSGTATERVRIDASGNVGIGTNAPKSILHTQNLSAGINTHLRLSHQNDYGGGARISFFADNNSTEINRIENELTTDATASGNLKFFTFTNAGGLTQKMYISGAGNVGIGLTPTGRNNTRLQIVDGIGFPATQVASSDPNTLDDYEEGTFDAGFAFGGASVSIVYSFRQCRYTKIGRVVHISGQVTISSKGSSTGTATITGLPFVVANENGGYSAVSIYLANITFTDFAQAFASTNTQTISLREVTNAGTITVLTDADFSANAEIIFSCTYTV